MAADSGVSDKPDSWTDYLQKTAQGPRHQRGGRFRGNQGGRGGGRGQGRGFGGNNRNRNYRGSSNSKRFHEDADDGEYKAFGSVSGEISMSSLSYALPVAEEDRRTAKDVNYWRYEYFPEGPVPEEPFKFEPPETDDHIEAMKFVKEIQKEKQLMTDSRTGNALDCRGMHGVGVMCQFCDGRRGSWVVKNKKPEIDPGFLRYQESIINSGPGKAGDSSGRRSVFVAQEDEDEAPKGQQELEPGEEDEDGELGISSVNVSVVG